MLGQPDDNFLKGLLLVPAQLEGEQEQCTSLRSVHSN